MSNDDSKSTEDRRELEKNRFKFDAAVNIGHILTTMAMAFALFNWGSSINSAIAAVNVEVMNIKESRLQTRQETLQAINEINHKLDRLAERSKR